MLWRTEAILSWAMFALLILTAASLVVRFPLGVHWHPDYDWAFLYWWIVLTWVIGYVDWHRHH